MPNRICNQRGGALCTSLVQPFNESLNFLISALHSQESVTENSKPMTNKGQDLSTTSKQQNEAILQFCQLGTMTTDMSV